MSKKNYALFFKAIEEGAVDTVKWLINDGYNVNAESKRSGYTPLTKAAYKGHTEIVELLIAHGADINAKNSWGDTALMEAAYAGKTEVVEMLIAHGADVNAKGGSTALMKAVHNEHMKIMEMLIAHGADVNAQDNWGNTALMLAASYGHTEIVEMLIANGADINAKNNNGETALMLATEKLISVLNKERAIKCLNTIKALLEHGEDLSQMLNRSLLKGDNKQTIQKTHVFDYLAQYANVNFKKHERNLLLAFSDDTEIFQHLIINYNLNFKYLEVIIELLKNNAEDNILFLKNLGYDFNMKVELNDILQGLRTILDTKIQLNLENVSTQKIVDFYHSLDEEKKMLFLGKLSSDSRREIQDFIGEECDKLIPKIQQDRVKGIEI